MNAQFAKQNETRRKVWRGIFIGIAIVGAGILLGELIEYIWSQAILRSTDASMSIIGGADGPTAMLIARTVNPIGEWILGVIATVFASVGIYKTKK